VNQVKHFHHNQHHQNKNNHKQWSNGNNNNNNQWPNNNHHQNKTKSNTCGMCGYEYPHKGVCPAQGKKCNSCGRMNHFTQCCRSTNKSSSNQSYNNKPQFNQQSNQYKKSNNQQKHEAHQIHIENPDENEITIPSINENRSLKNALNDSSSDSFNSINGQLLHSTSNNPFNSFNNSNINSSSSFTNSNSDEYNAFAVNGKTSKKCPRIDVLIGDQVVNMGPDTQSSINSITLETYNKLQPKPELQVNNSIVYSYDGNKPMSSMGKFEAKISANNRSIITDIMVFEQVRDNLLSFESCIQLQVLNNIINQTYSVQKDEQYKSLKWKYPNVFSNKIGKLKDFNINLHINKDIRPCLEKARRHPIHIKEKLEAQLRKMEEKDIIEDATGPTPWVSEILALPKPNKPDQLRIVIDARLINVAIERERHNTPTLEDLIVDLNDAKFISKLDLNDAYHQMELSEECRYITTFRTPLGLKRYKRLSQGIKSAQELFHHTLETKLAGLDGVENKIDDIYVHGKTIEEHDQRLLTLLDRLNEIGLTVNIDKCEFGKTELDFYGLRFSDKGIALTDHKIKALKEASPPKTASELRSFLGLASYCSRYIPNLATISDKLWKLTRNKVKWN